jgi:hypothetical protein
MYFQMRSEALKRARAVKCMAANFLHSEAWLLICLTFAFACTEKKEASASIFFFWFLFPFFDFFSLLGGCFLFDGIFNVMGMLMNESG